MNDTIAKRLVVLYMIGLFVLLGVIFYVLNGQHDGCERSKLDRGANAHGWRTAQNARLNTVAKELDISFEAAWERMQEKARPNEPSDLDAARRYNEIAKGLERRSRVSCPGDFLPGEVL